MHAKDGSFHHSAGRAKLHDEMQAEKPKAMPKAEGGGDGKAMSIEEHVQQHGPAHTMGYHHNKQTNKHHVHSTHGDGMAHESEHDSEQEAHKHMAKALNLGQEDTQEEADNETPDEAYEHEEEPARGNPFLK